MWFSETRRYKLGSSKQRMLFRSGSVQATWLQWCRAPSDSELEPASTAKGRKELLGGTVNLQNQRINSEGEDWHNCEHQTSFNCSQHEKQTCGH